MPKFGVRWQSKAATPLLADGNLASLQNLRGFESGVALRFLPQSEMLTRRQFCTRERRREAYKSNLDVSTVYCHKFQYGNGWC